MRHHTRRLMVVATAVVLLGAAGGCSEDRGAATPITRPLPSTTTEPTDSSVAPTAVPTAPAVEPVDRIEVTQVASLTQPVALVPRPGSDLLYAAERAGVVRALVRTEGGVALEVLPDPVLDVSDRVVAGYVEQGLLGLAFSPDGRELFVNFTAKGGTAGVTTVERYRMDGDRAEGGTREQVLAVDQPNVNHNGGDLHFGPDGMLYVGLGDGGSQGDPHGNGQDLKVLLGKVLRLDVLGSGSRRGYTIPDDNPLAGRDGQRPEIWLWGVRNPWRFSFDAANGDMWIGDVGGSEREEIDHLPAEGARPGGALANLGWNLREGTVDTDEPGDRRDLVDPVYDYSHDGGGCTVVGGFRYRGTGIPGLVGTYVFGDYCDPELRGLTLDASGQATVRALSARVENLAAFGEAGDRELYAVSLDGPVYRIGA